MKPAVIAMLAVVIASLTSGCVFIPTPHYYAMGSRENLTAQSTNLIQLRQDTIENVMLKLGEPDAISPDEHRMTYVSEKIIGQLFVLMVDTDGSELPDVPQYQFLNILFDENGMVTNRFLVKEIVIDSLPDNRIEMFVGSIRGEPIKVGFKALCNPDFVFVNSEGQVMLTDSALYYVEEYQWGNGKPALSLRYDSIVECWANDSPFPMLTIRAKDGHFYSFSNFMDESTLESAKAFIHSKMKARTH